MICTAGACRVFRQLRGVYSCNCNHRDGFKFESVTIVIVRDCFVLTSCLCLSMYNDKARSIHATWTHCNLGDLGTYTEYKMEEWDNNNSVSPSTDHAAFCNNRDAVYGPFSSHALPTSSDSFIFSLNTSLFNVFEADTIYKPPPPSVVSRVGLRGVSKSHI